jgi:hypothetical protein
MKKALAALVLAAAGTFGLSGCYLSRQVAGDDLVGGPVNPVMWITVPLDTILLPFELYHFWSTDDSWQPWSADEQRYEYVDKYKPTR